MIKEETHSVEVSKNQFKTSFSRVFSYSDFEVMEKGKYTLRQFQNFAIFVPFRKLARYVKVVTLILHLIQLQSKIASVNG